MDLISDYAKQSNFQLVTYSQSAGSAGSPAHSYIAGTNEILCDSKDNKQSVSNMSVSLKRPIESALNVPYDPSKKSHTSVRKGISETRKRCIMMDNCSPNESKKIKLNT